MQKSFLFGFFVLSFLFYNCSSQKSGLINVTDKVCSVDDDCITDDPCISAFCNSGFCSETALENNATCGNSKVCYEGECLIAVGKCSNNADCSPLENTCKSAVCSNNLCIYTNLENNTSCGEDNFCINGYCSKTCFIDENCNDNNKCTNELCKNIIILENKQSVKSSIFNDGNNWWIADVGSNKVYKYNNDWTYTTFSFSVAFPGGQVTDLSVNNSKIYILSNKKIFVYNTNGESLETVDINTQSNIPEDISSLYSFFYKDNMFYLFTFSSNNNEGKVYILDSNFKYLSQKQIDIAVGRARFDGNNWILYDNGGFGSVKKTLYKYNEDFIYTGESKTIQVSELDHFGAFSYSNGEWNVLFSNNQKTKIYKYTNLFNVKSYCEYSSVEESATCELGFCNNGMCAQCSNNQHCDDKNICTLNTCEYGICNTKKKDLGESCGNGKACQDGICINAGCLKDADCPSDTYCKHNFCNLATFKCGWEALNNTNYCTVTPAPYGGIPLNTYTCNAGNCTFNPINIGLCNELFTNTGNIHGLLIADTARALNNGEEVRAVAGKFLDNVTYKCAGYYYLPVSAGTIFPVFSDDTGTPIKDGFAPNDIINLYIRTNNYVCRVKANYDTTVYTGQEKWYPLGISKIIKFKDMNGNANIDFSNTANCTHMGQ